MLTFGFLPFSVPSERRNYLLDGATDSSGVEELAQQVHGWSITLAYVRSGIDLVSASTVTIKLFCRLIWGVSGAFLGIYAIVQDLNVPLIAQPQAFGGLALTSWTQAKVSHTQFHHRN